MAKSSERLKADVVLRLHRATAKGFAGFGGEEISIDFDPQVTVLQGQNASCKSAWLEVLRYGLGIVRAAASRRAHIQADGSALIPEIKITLLGDEREVLVTRKGDGSPEVRERVGEDWRMVPRPVEWLRDLIDVQAAGPHLFVAAKDDDRATMLLEALDLPRYSREAALKAAGLDGAFRLPAIPDGLHPLEDIEQVYKAVFDSRTAINSKAKAEADAADHLLAGLPAQALKDAAAEVALLDRATSARAAELAAEQGRVADALETATRDAETHLDLAGTKVKGDFRAEAQKLRTAHEAQAAEIRAQAERQVAALAAKVEQDVDVLRAKGEREIAAAEGVADSAVTTAQQTHAAALKALDAQRAALATDRERLAALRARQQAVATDAHVRATAEEGRTRAKALEARSDELTAALKALRRYATELAGTLPIRGLEVHYDDKGRRVVTLDKIPLDQVNSGRLRELGDEVSMLQLAARGTDRPRLPLVLVDWFEQVDGARRAAHLRGLADRGAQVVAAVVDVGPFRALRGEDALKGEAA